MLVNERLLINLFAFYFAFAGIGIAGLEGRQASLAADFSISQFSHLARLLIVHGRNSYKRSASLSQFVIHRGLIISTMQAIFSAVFYFSSVSLYQGLLMVGYVFLCSKNKKYINKNLVIFFFLKILKFCRRVCYLKLYAFDKMR